VGKCIENQRYLKLATRCTKESFTEFLEELKAKTLIRGKPFLVMDNCAVHKACAKVAARWFRPVFQTVYSSPFNNSERMWLLIKSTDAACFLRIVHLPSSHRLVNEAEQCSLRRWLSTR